MGADLAAAAGGDMDQVTPALPQARAPQTDPQCHSQPAAIPGSQLCWCWGEERDLVQLSWAVPREGIAPSNPTAAAGREGAGREQGLA